MSKQTKKKRLKHNFIFIDETGDPGPRGSDYYACCVLHVCADNFKHLYSVMCVYRFVLDYYRELKSFKIKDSKLKKLNRLLYKKRRYFRCSVAYLDKKQYRGPYLHSTGKYKSNPNLFRKYIYRQTLDLHFAKYSLYSNKVEVVIDRASLNEGELENLLTYLRKFCLIPRIDYLTSVDSRYVDLVQLADLICGQYKTDGTYEIGKKEGFSYSFINDKNITYENARGEKY